MPDFVNARIGGLPAYDVIRDMKWFREQFTPTVSWQACRWSGVSVSVVCEYHARSSGHQCR